jgi:hypothetical protein
VNSSRISSTNISNLDLHCLYSKPTPISHEKKKDLLQLCKKNVIKKNVMQVCRLKKIKAPEPGVFDLEEDENY